MNKTAPALDEIKVASPCRASWDAMEGDERVRFCQACRLNVYNLSAMTRAQAESLVAATEGRRCVRFYQRGDGMVLTRDCPVGWAAVKRRLAWIGAAAVACLTAVIGVHVWGVAAERRLEAGQDGGLPQWIQRMRSALGIDPPQPPVVMGEICLPPPAPPPAP
jgi:hypothetical protein